MIYFNDGTRIDAEVHFLGEVCTIYTNEEPNTSGFNIDGFDCSDFIYLYRKGDDYYQLSNKEDYHSDNDNVLSLSEYQEMISSQLESSRKYTIKSQISFLKEKLAETDYIFIKMYEGCDMSQYDMGKIKNERQEIREKINELEEEL